MIRLILTTGKDCGVAHALMSRFSRTSVLVSLRKWVLYMRKFITLATIAVLMCGVFSTPTLVSAKQKTPQQKVVKKAKSKLGCRYVYGASGSKTFDCSGFVYYVYKTAKVKTKKKVHRSSCQGMYQSLKKYKVSSKLRKAKAGDIILYKNGGRYTHAALSLGKGNIIHASWSKQRIAKAKARHVNHSSVAVIRVLRNTKK